MSAAGGNAAPYSVELFRLHALIGCQGIVAHIQFVSFGGIPNILSNLAIFRDARFFPFFILSFALPDCSAALLQVVLSSVVDWFRYC